MYLLFIVFTGNIIFKLFVLEHNECDNFEEKKYVTTTMM